MVENDKRWNTVRKLQKLFDKLQVGLSLHLVIMSTTLATAKDIEHKRWFLLDAKGKVLGRLAVKIANILRGRNKPMYTPHMDTGDFVIVINAEKVKLTGNKNDAKEYMFYSGYQGGEKYVPVSHMRKKRPGFLIEHAVRGMLPKNKLSRKLIAKLKVYKGEDHSHASQQPIVIDVNG